MFTLSGDERDQGSMYNNIKAMENKSWSVALLMRHVLQYETTYSSALNILTSEKLIAPVYFILGGMNKGL